MTRRGWLIGQPFFQYAQFGINAYGESPFINCTRTGAMVTILG